MDNVPHKTSMRLKVTAVIAIITVACLFRFIYLWSPSSSQVVEQKGEKSITYRYLEALKFGNVDGVDTNVTVTVSGFASWTEVIRYKGE
jgi:hypothetical protein